jgi:2-amino-4-hydroxy-6-hydroxymethyldihydropteridine diphosphokinase
VTVAYLGLGSNVGARHDHLQAAVDGFARADEVRVEAVSPVYETEAHTVDPDEQRPLFLNAVLAVRGDCSPMRLLRLGQALERAEGRQRQKERRWVPRPLDVDLLAVGQKTCRTDALTLPHPRIAERRFVLRPWADLAPNFVVPPPFDAPVCRLLTRCSDTAFLRRTDQTLSPGSVAG